nr:M14 metal carboxypeptidase 1 [Antheraea pernyi]
MVPSNKHRVFLDRMKASGMDVTLIIDDLQRAIDDQLKPANNARSSETFHGYSWNRYHNLDEIYAWLDELESNYPDIITVVTMGRSVEGRDIKGITINYRSNRNNTLIGMLEGTLHSREWISPETITWIVKEFLTSSDPVVRAMAESLEWHIFPVDNPDGYVYTFTTHRMWRKNRSPNNTISCASSGVDDDMSHGVDLNRNFDFVWMSIGASDNPCTNTYAGPRAFSEPEAVAIAQYVLNLKSQGQFIYYIAFHSYTQLIIIPYSHVNGTDVLLANNYADMYEIGIRSAEALAKRFGTVYRVGVSADVMYPMSGTSFDWVKYAADVPVTYLIELRDLGEYGFLLPPEQIILNNMEIMDAFIEMDIVTRTLGYYASGTSCVVSFATVLSIALFMLIIFN